MITFDKLAYSMLDQIRGGLLSDDEAISLRLVKYWINNTRSMLIRQDLDKGKSISASIIQTISCLELIEVDASTCPCSIPVGCTIMRTVRKIPKPIETAQRDLIVRVGPINMTARAFTLINQFRASWSGYSRFNINPKAFYRDEYIWVLNAPDGLKYATVQGVFENPEDLASYVSCSNTPCYTDSDPYPINAWMINAMEKIIMENNFRIAVSMPTDDRGNAKPDYSTEQNKE